MDFPHRMTLAAIAAASLAGALPLPAFAQSGSSGPGCLPSGNGYLRARIRGALDLDIDWHNAEMECDGSLRPDGTGLRVSFAGPASSDGRRVRLVFGLGKTTEGQPGKALPTNLTVIFEGEKRVFATRGEDKCTVDELRQERMGNLGGKSRSYRAIARGFCTGPATAFDRDARIVVSSFDFAGRLTIDDALLGLDEFPKTSVEIQSAGKPQRFDSWVATEPRQQAQGLMFVNDLPPDKGMLFLLPEPRPMSMWMKNTYVELDMVFISPGGRIERIAERTTPHSLATISSNGPVEAVLEIRGGEAKRRGMKTGDRVTWTPPASSR